MRWPLPVTGGMNEDVRYHGEDDDDDGAVVIINPLIMACPHLRMPLVDVFQ